MIEVSVASYPETSAARDPWIVAQRPAHNEVDPNRPYAFLVEQERSATGEVVDVATIFLTNRECPWRCVMCDLWRNTLTETVPAGAITQQIAHALERLPAATHVKLYNSGSFFDAGAIPLAEYEAIAALLRSFARVIVESHPSLIGERTLRFEELVSGRLEVAMGLETVHEDSLARMNKRMTLDQYRVAANFLRANDIDLRSFVLVQPPFVPGSEALHWASRSIDFAFDCGASAVSLIPTRANNGAMEFLERAGDFTPPSIATVEASLEYGIGLQRGRVFIDLWDIDRFTSCVACRAARIARLAATNLSQVVVEEFSCNTCGNAS